MTCAPESRCITPQGRWWAGAVGMFGLVTGLGPWVDADNLSSPIFRALVDWMPLRWWGAGFLTTFILSVVTILTRRRTWFGAMLANNLTVTAAWTSAIVYGRFWLGLPLSMAAMGLWGFVIVTHVLLLVGLAVPPWGRHVGG